MSRLTGPKARIARRFGINIFGSEKFDKILAKRNFPPGMHGKKRFSKPTEFGKQLAEKQKIRFMYGITERQCRNYYRKAATQKGDTGMSFMQYLERRLDNVIFRAGFAVTRFQSRQMAAHGIFMMNGHRVDIPSIEVKEGDVFEVRAKKQNSKLFEELEKTKTIAPPWLKVDLKEKRIEIVRLPAPDDFEKLASPQMIVEFYSK